MKAGLTIAFAFVFVTAQEAKLKPWVSERMVDAVLNEVRRLESLVPEEERAFRERPCPSRQLICMVLVGLSAGSPEVPGLDEDGRKSYSIDRHGKVFQVVSNVRVSARNQWTQDKSGGYCLQQARLFVLRDGRWNPEGWGEMPVEEKK